MWLSNFELHTVRASLYKEQWIPQILSTDCI